MVVQVATVWCFLKGSIVGVAVVVLVVGVGAQAVGWYIQPMVVQVAMHGGFLNGSSTVVGVARVVVLVVVVVVVVAAIVVVAVGVGVVVHCSSSSGTRSYHRASIFCARTLYL
jgi:hypothetical protein